MIQEFIKQYKEIFKQEVVFDDSLVGLVQKAKHTLLNKEFFPSSKLKEKLDHLEQRATLPLTVAITGQFSSGKSTFLNALIGKNVLPTGITPVTSKVNYIQYGEDFNLKVVYKNGKEEYHSIENISTFTDQRQDVQDIKYLTLFAPLSMLREIVFVDTPGLNSQSDSDTKTTQEVLQDVDGIIWLTLIDNAGKQSEVEVLEEYINKYSSKSLCVLNQKDKYSKEQVEKTINYVTKNFSKYFAKVIAISSLQALKARSSDKETLLENNLEKFLKSLKEHFKNKNFDDEFLQEQYQTYKVEVQKVLESNLQLNLDLLKESNIQMVLDFINTQIRPKANSAKEYALNQQILQIKQTLQKQYEFFITIFDEVKGLLTNLDTFAKNHINHIDSFFTKELKGLYLQINNIVETIANEIYANVKSVKQTRYVKKKALLKKENFVQASYTSFVIDQDTIFKKLFIDDELVLKLYNTFSRQLKQVDTLLREENEALYKEYEKTLKGWKVPYENIQKTNELYSDGEFANIRKFASKVYELLLKPFNDARRDTQIEVALKLESINSYIKAVFKSATEVCIAKIEKDILESCKLYETDPTKFSIYEPTLEDIMQKLKLEFNLDELESLMTGNFNFISKEYKKLLNSFDTITKEKLDYIENIQNGYREKVGKLVSST